MRRKGGRTARWRPPQRRSVAQPKLLPRPSAGCLAHLLVVLPVHLDQTLVDKLKSAVLRHNLRASGTRGGHRRGEQAGWDAEGWLVSRCQDFCAWTCSGRAGSSDLGGDARLLRRRVVDDADNRDAGAVPHGGSCDMIFTGISTWILKSTTRTLPLMTNYLLRQHLSNSGDHSKRMGEAQRWRPSVYGLRPKKKSPGIRCQLQLVSLPI